jgi:TonB-dependent receptor
MSGQLSNTIKSTLLASAAGAVMSLSMTSVVQAQTSEEEVADVDEIIVTGIRATTENALANKRKADVILDGISADDLGNFPDLNLGEALQRITGVQIDREAARRNATISVRGLPGNFTKTTLMGQNISSPNRTGSNPFGVFDSAIFNGVDVEKSFTAQSLSGGLAANVNLKLKSALERRDGSLVVRARGEYEELPQKLNPGIYASGAKHFNDGKFGVFGTVSYSKQDFRRDAINITRYESNSRTLNASNPAEGINIYAGDIRQFVEESIGDRLSGAAGFEFRPNDNLSFRLDGLFTQRNLDEATQDNIQIQPRLSANQITSVSGPEFVGNLNFDRSADGSTEDVYLHRVIEFDDPQVVYGNRDDESLNETYALYPQLNWENDKFKVKLIGTYSKSESSTIFNQFDARILQTGGATSTSTATNGVSGFLDTGGGDIRDIVFSLDIPDDALQLGGGGYAITSSTGLSAARFNDATVNNRNLFTVAGFANGAERDLKAISGDFEYNFSKGPFVALKFGGRYEDENADIYRFENSIIGLNINNLDNSVIVPNASLTSGQGFFNGTAPGFLEDNFFSIDRDRARELLLPLLPTDTIFPRSVNGGNGNLSNFIDFVDLPNPFTEFNQSLQNARNGSDARRNFAIDQTFTAQRENTELYGMVKYDFGENYETFPVRGNFGLRYIKTDLSGLAEGLDAPGAGNYEEILPSANLIANITEDVVFQAAYYETFEAFNLAEFRPTAATISPAIPNPTAVDPENAQGTLSIIESNLGTDPRSSEAFDVGLAWYNRPGSIVGVNFFSKEVVEIQRQSTGGSNSAFCNAGFVDLLDNAEAISEIAGRTPFIDSAGNCRLDDGNGIGPRLTLSQSSGASHAAFA